MSIEEAEYILNEAVIEEPSISSYSYISAEDINQAINKMLEVKENNEKKIKELEEDIIREKNKLKNIIKEKELEIENLKSKNCRERYINKEIKYIKKMVTPLFLLEN